MNVIHPTVVDARHEHSRATVIASVPVPPAGPKLAADVATLASHRVDAGAVMFVAVVAELPHAVAASKLNSRTVREFTSATVAQRSPALRADDAAEVPPCYHLVLQRNTF